MYKQIVKDASKYRQNNDDVTRTVCQSSFTKVVYNARYLHSDRPRTPCNIVAVDHRRQRYAPRLGAHGAVLEEDVALPVARELIVIAKRKAKLVHGL